MYEANLSEKLLCEKTGAVSNYKRIIVLQEQSASEAVQGVMRKYSNYQHDEKLVASTSSSI